MVVNSSLKPCAMEHLAKHPLTRVYDNHGCVGAHTIATNPDTKPSGATGL